MPCDGGDEGRRRGHIIFSDGCRAVSDIVAAADGIRSAVRTVLFEQDEPHFSGYVAWRRLVPLVDLSHRMRSAVGLSFGGRRIIVNYPIRPVELMNFAAFAHHDAWRKMVAAQLAMSTRTAKPHRDRITMQLGVRYERKNFPSQPHESAGAVEIAALSSY